MVDYEEKFLSREYLETRLRDFKEIRQKQVTFEIVKSNRENSKSLYIEFYIDGIKGHTLRVSDHIVNTCHTQFIAKPFTVLTKKKKAQFVALVESSIRKAKADTLKVKLRRI